MRLLSSVVLGPSVVDAGFCELIASTLSSRSEDVREKVLHALHALLDYCKLDLLVPQLESLRSHYKVGLVSGIVTHVSSDCMPFIPMVSLRRSLGLEKLYQLAFQARMYEENPRVKDEYFESLFTLADDLVKHITDEAHEHIEL